MNDLVERLREHVTASHFQSVGKLVENLSAKNEEAADEIERLREQLERCADVTEHWENNLARQVNEIAREALRANR